MKDLINKVRQWGLDRGIVYTGEEGQDKAEMMEAQARYTLKETAELLDAYAGRDIVGIKDAIGDVLVTLIVGASSDDDFFDSLEDWFGEFGFHEVGFDEVRHAVLSITELLERIVWIAEYKHASDYDYIYAIKKLDDIVDSLNWKFDERLTLKDCLEHAYNEIKDRTGKVVDGQFIKDE